VSITRSIRRDVTSRAVKAASDAARYAFKSSPLLRKQARSAVNALLSYEGAKRPYFDKSWGTHSEGPTSVVLDSLPTLRSRARYLGRNDPHTGAAYRALVNGLVGSGMSPRSRTGDAETDEDLDARWALFAAECMAGEDYGFSGAQHVLAGGAFESGSAMFRRLPRTMADGLSVPLQIEILEADMLDTSKDTSAFRKASTDGHTIVGGIEFDAQGRRAFYHVYKQHPSESSSSLSTESVPVPADDIAHFYLPGRPGQVQGAPRISPVIQAINQMDGYRLSERIRKRVAASLVAFVLGAEESGFVNAEAEDGSASPARLLEDVQPGAIIPVGDGTSVTLSQPAADASYSDFNVTEDHRVAAGLGVTYELMTGDLKRVNWASYRVGHVPFRADMEQLRESFFTPMALDRVYGWFITALRASGQLSYSVAVPRPEWSDPLHIDVDRLKEAKADTERLANKTSSYQDTVARGGKDWRKTIDAIAEAEAYAKSKGVSLDSVSQNVTVEDKETDDDGNRKPVQDDDD
jgi:lambda family phage portal protein